VRPGIESEGRFLRDGGSARRVGLISAGVSDSLVAPGTSGLILAVTCFGFDMRNPDEVSNVFCRS
jgi:hypothetical protein